MFRLPSLGNGILTLTAARVTARAPRSARRPTRLSCAALGRLPARFRVATVIAVW